MTVKATALALFDPGGIAALKTTTAVEVIQSEGMHDCAVITLQGESLSVPELQPGTPVRMTYGWQPVDLQIFYGYIDHVAPCYDRSVPDAASLEEVVCLGASYALKDPFVGTWNSVQASSLVQQIAARYHLSALIENDDYTWPQVASPGSSAWSFLVSLANKVGYSLAVNQCLLRFISVDAALKQHWSTMPVFKSRSSAQTYLEQSITNFSAIQGDATALPSGTKAVRSISGLDPATGQVIGAVDDGTSLTKLGQTAPYPFFTQQISDTVVNSQGHAQAAVAGMSANHRFPYQATATLSGLTSVTQGTPIVLTGLDTNNNGVWWVQEVTHAIKSFGYWMDVTLGRDSTGDTGLRPVSLSGVAYTTSNPFSYAVSNAPVPVLIKGRWQSPNQFNVIVGSH
jgi:phage protein D